MGRSSTGASRVKGNHSRRCHEPYGRQPRWNDHAGSCGAIQGDPNTAYTFAGGNTGSRVVTSQQLPDQQDFAAEAWIKTSTNSGGRIIGFSNGTSGASGKSDRHVYMRNDGEVDVWRAADSLQTITSTKSYNDNKFHRCGADERQWDGTVR